MRNITMTTVSQIDFNGLGFYVEAFGEFDKRAFAEHCGVRIDDIDERQLRAVEDRVSEIQVGQFVRVELDDKW